MSRFLILFLLWSCTAASQSINYPVTQKIQWTDTYPGGIKIDDPYHWLEDDHSPETKDWVTAQNGLTSAYLDSITWRDSLHAKMARYWNFTRYETPFHSGSNYMYYRNDGLQNQPVLFYMRGLNYVPMAYFDPNKISEDGTLAITQTIPNNDGSYLAFVLSKSGSDWNEVRIKETKTLKSLPEYLAWVKFSDIAWFKDGFFYSRYDIPLKGRELTQANRFHKIYYHKLNTPQSNDSLVFEDKENPLRIFRAYVTPEENALVIMGEESTSGNSVLVCDLKKKERKLIPVIQKFDYTYIPLGSKGAELFFQTDQNADRGKIMSYNIQTGVWKDVVPQRKNEILREAEIASGYFMLNYMKDAGSKVYIHLLSGEYKAEVPLPGIGTVDKINGSPRDTVAFLSYTTFTSPAVIYRFNLKTLILSVQYKVKLPFSTDEYITEQVFFRSKDSTRIPMFLVHKKGYKPDGNTPTLVYGYGGFNISKTPEFKAERMPFLEAGGLLALPNLRGGGEYGRAWHRDGTLDKKQNVFDDCIAATEWLISNGYTNPDKLAIQGRSNGGLLAGAVMTQRPDLFKVALPAVGVMDMLRYHKFTIGWAWASDYGTSDDSAGFRNLIRYSPLHNLKDGVQYPATLITTADHDDRVVPAHSFKFAAKLQEVQRGNNPVLIRIDTNAGHGAGKPTNKQIEEQTDIFTFLMYNLGMKP